MTKLNPINRRNFFRHSPRRTFYVLCIAPIIITLLIALPRTALALDANSFLGLWHSELVHAHVHHPHGTHVGESYGDLEFKEVHNGLIHGTMSWRQVEHNKAKIDRAGKTIRGGSTEFVGVLNFDNVSGQLLLTEDNGVMHVRLVDEDTMQVIYVEQGDHEATLFRTVVKRHRDD